MTIKFQENILYGKVGEDIFRKDFLEFLRINYEDVTGRQAFQIIDADFLTKIGLYEIKLNYKDNKQLFIEEYTNINEELNFISMGWVYKSKADLIVFISKQTRNMIFLPFTKNFKQHYENIKNSFTLYKNKVSEHNGKKWQSAFRIIPFSSLNGYISFYKKCQN